MLKKSMLEKESLLCCLKGLQGGDLLCMYCTTQKHWPCKELCVADFAVRYVALLGFHVGNSRSWNLSYCSCYSLCMHPGLSYCKTKLESYTILTLFPNGVLLPVHPLFRTSLHVLLISKMLRKYLLVCKIARNSHAGSIFDFTSEAQHLGREGRPMANLMEGIVGITCPFYLRFWFAQATLCLVDEKCVGRDMQAEKPLKHSPLTSLGTEQTRLSAASWQATL